MKRVIPPGHVDALCLTCRPNGGLAVVIPEGTTTCPHCGQEVHPLSLPHMPPEHGKNGAAPVPTTPAATPEVIVLPDWIDGATSWHAATVQLVETLGVEEGQIAAELRRVRSLRKLLTAVLDRIEPKQGGTS